MVPLGRYAVIARRPNGDRLCKSVTVAYGASAKVDFSANLPPSPNEFMSQEASRGEVAAGPALKNGRLGQIQGFAGHALEALSVTREATRTSTRTSRQSVWTLQAWSLPDQATSSPPAHCTFQKGLSFLKVRTERHCLAVGLLDETGFGPIVFTPPFRKPLHITFLAKCLATRAAARYLNPSGQRALAALATPEEPPVADLLSALGSISLDHAAELWQQNSASPTNALNFVRGKFDNPSEALLGAHFLLRFLPAQLPLVWADNLRLAFPGAADGPVISAWLRMTSSATDVDHLNLRKLHADVRQFLAHALDRPVTWFARTRRLLVDGLRLEQLQTPQKQSTTSTPPPSAYLDFGAHAGGLEAFWGTHPFSPGTMRRSGAPPSRKIVTIALEGTTFTRVLSDSAPAAAGQRAPAPGGTPARVTSATGPAPHASATRGDPQSTVKKRVPAKRAPAKSKRAPAKKVAAKKRAPAQTSAPVKKAHEKKSGAKVTTARARRPTAKRARKTR